MLLIKKHCSRYKVVGIFRKNTVEEERKKFPNSDKRLFPLPDQKERVVLKDVLLPQNGRLIWKSTELTTAASHTIFAARWYKSHKKTFIYMII